MLTEGRNLSEDRCLVADVCVVGAGPAGLIIAEELAGRGHEVVVLESGAVGVSERGRDRCVAEESGRPYPAHTSRDRGFGGTSLRWNQNVGLRARPMDDVDFEARPGIDDVGWPFGREALDPFYDRGAESCGLAAFGPLTERVVERARDEDRLLVASPALRTTFFQRTHPWAFVRRVDQVRGDRRIHLVLGATATELPTLPDGGGVEEVRFLDDERREGRVRSKLVVLAAGAIENARLLLASKGREPSGLGNGHDLVGRHFMEHPHIHTGTLVLDQRTAARRLAPVYGGEELGDPWPVVEGVVMLDPAIQRREGLPNVGFWLHPTSARKTAEIAIRSAMRAAGRGFGGSGDGSASRDLRQAARNLRVAMDIPLQRLVAAEPYNRHFAIEVESEQAPHWDSRVTLSSERDDLGQQRAHVHWKLADSDLEAIRRSQELLDGELQRLGIGRLVGFLGDESPPTPIGIGNHHMGTTRMGTHPRNSVVDPDCRVHGVANLYVAGSSVFPRGGAANPTLTVAAMAHRLADELGTRLAARAPALGRTVTG